MIPRKTRAITWTSFLVAGVLFSMVPAAAHASFSLSPPAVPGLYPSSGAPAPAVPEDDTASKNILPPGNNGFYGVNGPGPHFDDQWAMYRDFQWKSMQFFGPGENHTAESPKPGVVIYRNSFGVPSVYGETFAKMAFGAGYASAEDRLFQMELFRRAAQGKLAEILGPGEVAYDEATRLTGYTPEELDAMYDQLPMEEKQLYQNYVDGINAYLRKIYLNPTQMPIEFLGTVDPPRPWTIRDVIALDVFMARGFATAGGEELQNAALLADLAARYGKDTALKIFNDMKFRNDPASPVSVPARDGAFPYHYGEGKIAWDLFPSSDAAAAQAAKWQDAIQTTIRKLGLPHFGSNAMAVAPKKSATGHALLYGGPQLDYYVPQIVYEIELHSGDWNVRGMTFAGAGPVVLIGHGSDFAWTVTTGFNDMTDTYAVRIKPDRSAYIGPNGQWVPFEKRTETILVRPDPQHPSLPVVRYTVYRTDYGPVIAWDPGGRYAYTQKFAVWKHELDTANAMFAINRSKNIQQFEDAIRQIPVSINLLYANSSGDIGYFHVGRQPVRPSGYDDRFPIPGGVGYEWADEPLAWEDLPHVVNPEQGWVANWNNKPSTGWDNGDENWVWGENQRVGLLFSQLEKTDKVTAGDLDTFAHRAAFGEIAWDKFKPWMVGLLEKNQGQSETDRKVLQYLKDWDGQRQIQPTDTSYVPAWTIFDAWYDELQKELVDAVFGTIPEPWKNDTLSNELYLYRYYASLMLHILEGNTQYDWLHGQSADDVLQHALDRAAAQLQQTYGADMSKWRKPALMTSFTAFGAGHVDEFPFQNRGTYAQIIELLPKK